MLKSLTVSAQATTLTLCAVFGAPARARTLDRTFLPPQLEPRDVCTTRRAAVADDRDLEDGDDRPTDHLRIRYLDRDTRRLQAEDAVESFDFIDTWITRLANVDADFAGGEELLARVALHIEADRSMLLRQQGLIGQLRAMDAISARSLCNTI